MDDLALYSLLVSIASLCWTWWVWHSTGDARKCAEQVNELTRNQLTAEQRQKLAAKLKITCKFESKGVTEVRIENEGPGLALNVNLHIDGHADPLNAMLPISKMPMDKPACLKVQGSGMLTAHEAILSWDDLTGKKTTKPCSINVNKSTAGD